MRHAPMTILLSAALGAAIVFSGCQSSGPSRLETATASVDDLRDALDMGSAEVDDVMFALRQLSRGERMSQDFKAYSKSLDRLEKAAQRVRARRAAMETRMQDHIEKWGEQLEGISNEEMRQISSQRMEELRSAMEALVAELEELKDAYEPFISNLRDIELVLANDLSRGGIEVANPLIRDAVLQAEGVNAQIAVADQAMDEAIAAFRS